MTRNSLAPCCGSISGARTKHPTLSWDDWRMMRLRKIMSVALRRFIPPACHWRSYHNYLWSQFLWSCVLRAACWSHFVINLITLCDQLDHTLWSTWSHFVINLITLCDQICDQNLWSGSWLSHAINKANTWLTFLFTWLVKNHYPWVMSPVSGIFLAQSNINRERIEWVQSTNEAITSSLLIIIKVLQKMGGNKAVIVDPYMGLQLRRNICAMLQLQHIIAGGVFICMCAFFQEPH